MDAAPNTPPSGARSLRFGLVIAVAVIVAYAGTFSAPFVLDSEPIATAYPSIRHLWPIWKALAPPHDGSTIEGRPVLNLSLAVSYALTGTGVLGYHAVNLAIHLLAALVLFGLARRTLQLAGARDPGLVAFAIGLIWAVHPLQTEAVTYVIQRAESLMGLFYLLTLYCFVRGIEGGAARPRAAAWFGLSWLACLLGMGTKEVMVSAPVMVFLYDRCFVAGTFHGAWRRRRAFHLSLASTWLLLAWLVAGSASRTGTAGFSAGMRWPDYAATQIYGLVHYLRLAFWPHPLVFDYGTLLVRRPSVLLPDGLIVLALAAAAIAGLRSKSPAGRAAGYCGAWYFAILAPTCLVPVATQTLAEHRLYLALAGVVAAAVLAADRACRRRIGLFLAFTGVAGAVLTAATLRRNQAYASAIALWADTVGRMPANSRARTQLGRALYDAGRIAEAEAQFQRAVALDPGGDFYAHYDLGNCLFQQARFPEAAAQFAMAARIRPASSDAHDNLGNALLRTGNLAAALGEYQLALRLDPGNSVARGNLSVARFNQATLAAQAERMPEAIADLEEALRLRPAFPEAQDNLGNALLAQGRLEEAVAHYREALRLKPDYPRAQCNLALALLRLGRTGEAIAHYQAALALQPGLPEAQEMLDRLRAAGIR